MASPSNLGLFAQKLSLSEHQTRQFEHYLYLLQHASCNVTALEDEYSIINYHFADSCAVIEVVNFTAGMTVVDVGTGGGFPGIPLAILYPHVKFILLEVVGKKREFLALVIKELGLTNCTVEGRDWRTFIRMKPVDVVDVVCARASLVPQELLRLFGGSSSYQNALLVYWASLNWEPTAGERAYIAQEYPYTVGERQRRLVIFTAEKLGS